MTIQNLFIADLNDILQIRLACQCGAHVALNPDDATLPFRCPQCQATWKGQQNAYEVELIENFTHAIKSVRAQQKANTEGPRVGLVFDMSNQAK